MRCSWLRTKYIWRAQIVGWNLSILRPMSYSLDPAVLHWVFSSSPWFARNVVKSIAIQFSFSFLFLCVFLFLRRNEARRARKRNWLRLINVRGEKRRRINTCDRQSHFSCFSVREKKRIKVSSAAFHGWTLFFCRDGKSVAQKRSINDDFFTCIFQRQQLAVSMHSLLWF